MIHIVVEVQGIFLLIKLISIILNGELQVDLLELNLKCSLKSFERISS